MRIPPQYVERRSAFQPRTRFEVKAGMSSKVRGNSQPRRVYENHRQELLGLKEKEMTTKIELNKDLISLTIRSGKRISQAKAIPTTISAGKK